MPRSLRLSHFLALLFVLAALLSTTDLGAAPNWQVKIHFQRPDGQVEEVLVERFRFVFYERRYLRRSGKGEERVKVEIKDKEQERHWIQNHELRKIRFHKIRRIDLLYQSDGDERALFLKVERRRKNEKKKLKIEEWRASQLRNAGNAPLPQFRGVVDGEEIDFPLPQLSEPAHSDQRRMIAIDFDFPGVSLPRKRF